ncbi:hypothetical protein AB205_0095790 [Aquarana catesbeiana]|uniref:Uncharacterized protein n=1 Tax=Aquarana catesbeiana TaxID=8400 RepID=A0A2G9R7T3_AQUCT|nr:hypothetical protein AB205_0095790 [Aquarana catesbeiana]
MSAVRFLWISQQRDMLENRLASQGSRHLRSLFKIPVDHWVISFPRGTVCHTKIFSSMSSFYCMGHYNVFAPKDYGITMCKFFTLPIPMPDVITDTFAWWEPKYDGSYIAVGLNNTYGLDDCQKADKGLVSTHRSPVFEPCLLARPDVNMCAWTLYPKVYKCL